MISVMKLCTLLKLWLCDWIYNGRIQLAATLKTKPKKNGFKLWSNTNRKWEPLKIRMMQKRVKQCIGGVNGPVRNWFILLQESVDYLTIYVKKVSKMHPKRSTKIIMIIDAFNKPIAIDFDLWTIKNMERYKSTPLNCFWLNWYSQRKSMERTLLLLHFLWMVKTQTVKKFESEKIEISSDTNRNNNSQEVKSIWK